MLRLILRCQAAFYVVTGIWPLLHLPSFEWVTGPKADDWLVHTMGLLLASIGVVLWLGTRRKPPPDHAIVLLGALTAASLAGIELRYGLTGRIWSIYLVDAALEIALVLLLVGVSWVETARHRPASNEEHFEEAAPHPRWRSQKKK